MILEGCKRRQSKGGRAGRVVWGGCFCSTWHSHNSTLLRDETESFICELQLFCLEDKIETAEAS